MSQVMAREIKSPGRPTDYRDTHPKLIMDLMTQGALNCQLYAALDTHKKTFYDWVGLYPEFAEAYLRGRAKAESYWALELQKMVLAGNDKGCKACIMILNNNFGWGRDENSRTVSNTQINIGNVNMVKSKEDYQTLLLEMQDKAKEFNLLDILPEDMAYNDGQTRQPDTADTKEDSRD